MDAWLDGKFVAAESVTVPVMAHSFSRGSAVFEVLDLPVEITDQPDAIALDDV